MNAIIRHPLNSAGLKQANNAHSAYWLAGNNVAAKTHRCCGALRQPLVDPCEDELATPRDPARVGIGLRLDPGEVQPLLEPALSTRSCESRVNGRPELTELSVRVQQLGQVLVADTQDAGIALIAC